ncbi:MAG TPA: 2OG-Fe(II) oxygenase [Sphingomicrobium sp.]|nr:2OG-Fe(II) oxygenase [Sphingomicrobium sp.]
MTEVERAYELLARGDVRHALLCLEGAGTAGDGACLLELGVWYLDGRYVRRDLARSREYFRCAGEVGERTAERVYICFLANGVGGAADWSAAAERLRKLAHKDSNAALQLELVDAMAIDEHGYPLVRPVGNLISTTPQAWAFDDFASAAECEYLIGVAEPLLQGSVIVDPATGQLRAHPVRTSDGAAFPWVSADMVITAINQRIAAASGTEIASGEPLQVLRYAPGQEYRPHLDALPEGGNQRVLTMLIYLNQGYAGGETFFTKSGLKFAGSRGTGLLFRNAVPGGQPDPYSEHAGLPVLRGHKFVASRWIRERMIAAG